MSRAAALAFVLLAEISTPVVGESALPAQQEGAVQLVAVLVLHARECSSNPEYKLNAEDIRRRFSEKFPQLERLVEQANAYRVMVGNLKFCHDAAIILNAMEQKRSPSKARSPAQPMVRPAAEFVSVRGCAATIGLSSCGHHADTNKPAMGSRLCGGDCLTIQITN